MKKIFAFLRSMRFGMLLLTVIAALSVVGTLVTQGQSAAYYAERYGSLGGVITRLGFDRMYATWYYVDLFAALCMNLMLCSVLRIGKIRRAKAALLDRVQHAAVAEGIPAEDAPALLRRFGFRARGDGLYTRRMLGLYGSLVTHIGLLMLLVAAACTFGLEQIEDRFVPVGERVTLADGCSVAVRAFSMEKDGQLDYVSDITVKGEDGQTQETAITVNHPARFHRHAVYQQSYAYAAVLDVETAQGMAERLTLSEASFISLDGQQGVYYMQLYGDYAQVGGQIMPANTRGGAMVRPCYLVTLLEGEAQHTGLVLPDEPFEIGEVRYTFRAPAAYPGLRVKTQPLWVTPLLYTSFAVLVAGLYLCFFHVPAAALVKEGAVRVASGKDAAELIQEIKDAV